MFGQGALLELGATFSHIYSAMVFDFMDAKFGEQTSKPSCITSKTSSACEICAQNCLKSHLYSKVWTAFIFACNSNVIVHSDTNRYQLYGRKALEVNFQTRSHNRHVLCALKLIQTRPK